MTFQRAATILTTVLLCAGCGGSSLTSAARTATSRGTAAGTDATPATAARTGTAPAGSAAAADGTLDTTDATSVTATAATASGTATSSIDAGPVKVRVVNLYAPADHPQGIAIDGYFAGDAHPNPQEGIGTPDFAALAFTRVSEYKSADPSKVGSLELFVKGQVDPIALQNINGTTPGRYTMFTYSSGSAGGGSAETFDETPSATSVHDRDPGALAAAPTGKALIVAVGGPLQVVDAGQSFNVGQPGKGCFALELPDAPNAGQTTTPVGGYLDYVADPGSLQIAFFDGLDTDCSHTPVIAPIAVQVAAGDRVFVVGYGTSTDSMKLMDIPIRRFPGDAPLASLPPVTTTSSAPAVDACSLITTDQATTALGAASDSGNADTSAGTCTYTAGSATLVIGTQSAMTKDAFDLLKSGASGAQQVGGVGDDAFLTTGPNGIIVLKGTVVLGISLDHHQDAGPDDPSIDGPLLRSLATAALAKL